MLSAPTVPRVSRWRRPAVLLGVVLCVIAGMALLAALVADLGSVGGIWAAMLFVLFPVSGLMLIVFARSSKDGRLPKARWAIASVPLTAAVFMASLMTVVAVTDDFVTGFDYGRAMAEYESGVDDAYERAEAGKLTPDELAAELRAVESKWEVARAEYRKGTILEHEESARAKALGLMLEGHDRVAAAEWAAVNSWSSSGYYELTLGRAEDAKRKAFELMDTAMAAYSMIDAQDIPSLYVEYELAMDRQWATGVKWAAVAIAYEQAATEMANAAVGEDGAIERLAAFGWSADEWEDRAKRSGHSAVIRDGYTVSQCAAAAIVYEQMAADMSDVVDGVASEDVWDRFDRYAALSFDCNYSQ